MSPNRRPWSLHVANLARAAFWLALIAIVLTQALGSRSIDKSRAALLARFEEERKSRVIAMIHREESTSIFGVPVAASISIDDSEAVLRAIRFTPPEQAVEIKGPQRVGDELLILADMAQKARVQVASFVAQVLGKHLDEKRSVQVA